MNGRAMIILQVVAVVVLAAGSAARAGDAPPVVAGVEPAAAWIRRSSAVDVRAEDLDAAVARGRAFLVAPLLGFAALAVLAAGEGGVWVQVLRGLGGFGLGMACWPLWQALNARSWPRLPLVLAELALPPLILWALAADVPLIGLDLLFAAAVLVFAGERGPVSAALRTAPMVWLGTLSYALYMVHGLVFGRVFDVMAAVQGRVGGEWVAAGLGGGDRLLLAPLQSALAVAAMMALALVAAWLAWRLVEWPARAWSRRLAARIGSNGANSAATRV